jgi:hypothetical protein
LDETERTRLLERYATGMTAVEDALSGITDEELVRPPAEPDEWPAREVAHHLADSESIAYIRLRRLIAEDFPSIAGYDAPEWARRLHYDRPITSAVSVAVAVRAASLELLEQLTPDEWTRRGIHGESGAYGVEEWLRLYAEHPNEHAAQIRASAGR